MSKKTVVFGASPNIDRTSYTAVNKLRQNNHHVIALGIRAGKIGDVEILTNWPKIIDNLHTITLYIGPKNQPQHYNYLIGLKPKRIIFNPGTENEELINLAKKNNIQVEIACTLVMLSLGIY